MINNNTIKVYRNKRLLFNLILPGIVFMFLLILFIRLPVTAGFQWLISGGIFLLLSGIAILAYTFFKFKLLFVIDDHAIEINAFGKRKKIDKNLIRSLRIAQPYWGRIFDYRKVTIEYTDGSLEHFYMPDFREEDLIQQWSNTH